MITVGLFGTCGNSTWRKCFIDEYNELDIAYFNPQVAEGTWHPGCIDNENEHLLNDDIIVFPVTDETTGQGSLAEIGFSILHAMKRSPERYFIIMIDDECKDFSVSMEQRKESNRTRSLVKSKVAEFAKQNSGVFLVSTLQDMFDLSVELHNTCLAYRAMRDRYTI